ncbi:MAG: hypothetical protein NWF05_06060 [Candidatus Bathyarchaeota archaeon]|nr:hypothetical protein [Candidatus Bathyarchaeota archaeon]
MAAQIEAIFEYTAEHPAVLMIIGGMFFAIVSIFTAPINGETTSFLRNLTYLLIVGGVLLHILSGGLRFLVRVFKRIFNIQD